ncbi:RAMP superfamily CRISPR-associated protein [Rhodospira trueperi]|uniref:CRISPR/Cas system CSM-associated protein Csm3, group 7 of RAMP superfamily n=1 Tax=Rhodospira trueperi TaxID=69960 RepID=A0A1G7IBK8_9PROT|nr:RAMP superfamily CRISPR-associated protein [Rhodospira trueperi]SDF10137.1 CRISPR/Cas system CSM-associated protein Csm3, group 7 of RAMP superfamily [Rhodospira trueperi]
MPRLRYDIEGTLEALSPLHVGTGEMREVEGVKGRPGDNAPPGVAALARDVAGAPLLPSTTLKGLLRGLAGSLGAEIGGPDAITLLLGEIKDTAVGGDEHGQPLPRGSMGLLTVFCAPRTGAVPDASAMPFADARPIAQHGLGDGVFVAARTRIDGASGTASHATLFFQEMVAKGTRFAFRCRIEARAGRIDKAEQALTTLKDLLAALTAEYGVALGKGQADGLGRVRLRPQTLSVTRRTVADDGTFTKTAVEDFGLPEVTAPPEVDRIPIRLRCDGPFAVIDASSTRERGRHGDEDPTPHLRAQRETETMPLLIGTGISGALRARAAWLWARNEPGIRAAAEETEGPVPDDRTVGPKDPVERLFGLTGFRGLLSIASLAVTAEAPLNFTSVRIDRFSGAPVDNALFTTAAFIGVDLSFTLTLRGGATSVDRALFNTLCGDIKATGLMLGHGTNKGFGWFDWKEAAA